MVLTLMEIRKMTDGAEGHFNFVPRMARVNGVCLVK